MFLYRIRREKPIGKQVNGLDLVIIRCGKNVSVLYGRCLHRGALMADGYIDGENIICGVHEASAKQLNNFFDATNELVKVVARSCGYNDVSKFNHNDLSTFDYDLHRLTGIGYAGVSH